MDTQTLSSPFGNHIFLLSSSSTFSLVFTLWYSWPHLLTVMCLCCWKGGEAQPTEVAVHRYAVNSSCLGKSNEMGGITLPHPTDRALFSWFSLFRSCSTSLCVVPPSGCLSPACCLVGAQLWPQSSLSFGARSSLCSLPMDGPCLQPFSNLAWEGEDEVSDLFASEAARPFLLVKGTWDKRCYWCFKVFLS